MCSPGAPVIRRLTKPLPAPHALSLHGLLESKAGTDPSHRPVAAGGGEERPLPQARPSTAVSPEVLLLLPCKASSLQLAWASA